MSPLTDFIYGIHWWVGCTLQGSHSRGRWFPFTPYSNFPSHFGRWCDPSSPPSWGTTKAQLRVLSSFCDHKQMVVNLSKTKVMIFNASKNATCPRMLDDTFTYLEGAMWRLPLLIHICGSNSLGLGSVWVPLLNPESTRDMVIFHAFWATMFPHAFSRHLF